MEDIGESFPPPDQNNRIVCSGSLTIAITKRNQIFHWNKEMHLELHVEFLPLNLYLSLWIHTSFCIQLPDPSTCHRPALLH
ncbi:hypothetical protein LWI28_003796 [Acer negundo]|uniref:Uncharacterized protein n=1 Tax=Acer negundo TaxID=4023 RepID=A0AAD5NRA2_ACENE|nr:hypothetical protein LWI28_003796 [Acer negundo]